MNKMTTKRMIEVLKSHIEVEKAWNIEENQELIEALTGAVEMLSGKPTIIAIDEHYQMNIRPYWAVTIEDEHGTVRYENQYGEYEPLASDSVTKEEAEEEGKELIKFYNEIIKEEQ